MKRALLLPTLLLIACTQEPPPPPHPTLAGSGILLGQPIKTPPEPEKEEETYGLSAEESTDLHWAIQRDDSANATRLYSKSSMPLSVFAEQCLSPYSGRCLKWAITRGYKVRTTRDYWLALLPDWCCDLNEEEADKLRHVLVPLLKANPELLKTEYIAPVMCYLAECGCRKTMQQVLNLGAPAEVTDDKGLTPLDYALFYEYRDIEKMLRAHGATRHTPRPTAEEMTLQTWRKRLAELEAMNALDADYLAKVKALKPGAPVPPELIYDIIPPHRPHPY